MRRGTYDDFIHRTDGHVTCEACEYRLPMLTPKISASEARSASALYYSVASVPTLPSGIRPIDATPLFTDYAIIPAVACVLIHVPKLIVDIQCFTPVTDDTCSKNALFTSSMSVSYHCLARPVYKRTPSVCLSAGGWSQVRKTRAPLRFQPVPPILSHVQ